MRNLIPKFLSAAASISLPFLAAESPSIELFSPSQVQLKEGFFHESLELNGDYILKHDLDRLLAQFRIEAGLEPKAEIYGNWESSGLNGHSAGHFLSALSLMFANTGQEIYKEKLDYMVSELAACQASHGNGYVGGIPDAAEMWQKVSRGDFEVNRFGLAGRWVPWYNIHKTYVGLKDAWTIGENETAKEVLIKLCDWTVELTDSLTDEQMQEMLYAEHGGMNDILAEAYQLTGDDRYLALAKRFSHREILDPLAKGRDELTGFHANTQIPKVIGFQRIANATGDENYATAAATFWDNVVYKRSIAFGGNSVREHFHATDDFHAMLESREGPESCNTHNMMRLSSQLFLSEGTAEIVDFYERALFNHILSVQEPNTGGLVYFTPIRPRHYRVYSQAEQAFWCCVGSGIENPGRYTEMIYAKAENELFVNLFVASQVEWREEAVVVQQDTQFPQSESTRLSIKTGKPKTFTLSIRKPAWLGEDATILVNDKAMKVSANQDGFFSIERKWKNGDVVDIKLPLHVHTEQLPDGSDFYAFLYGPIVLAARMGTEDMPGVFAGDGRMEHIAPGPYFPLNQATTLIGDPSKLSDRIKPITDEPLRFTLSGEIEPKQDITLEPFYQIHESRYTMYWRALPENEFAKVMDRIAQEEAAKEERQSKILDTVAPGEQQPEVEHNFEDDNSKSGILLGERFREASGWFEYDFRHKNQNKIAVVLRYWGSQWGRACKILVDGTEIGTLEANGTHAESFVDASFPVPETLLETDKDTITVRIESHDGKPTPSLFEVSLMRSE